MQHSQAWGPFLYRRVSVNCTGFPLLPVFDTGTRSFCSYLLTLASYFQNSTEAFYWYPAGSRAHSFALIHIFLQI